jgi:hypothetical protein
MMDEQSWADVAFMRAFQSGVAWLAVMSGETQTRDLKK